MGTIATATLIVLAVTATVLAQSSATTATLGGTVADESGAALVDTEVAVLNLHTGMSRIVATDGTGRYFVPALPPGEYVVTATRDGFSAQRVEPVILALGAAAELPLSLRVAPVQATVTAVAPGLLADVAPSTGAESFAARVIENLPTNGRNFIAFSQLAPGVATDLTAQQAAASASGLTFVGQRGRSNNVTVDGLDNNDRSVGGVRATFSQEAVQEFQVLVHSYGAEFGRAAGGVANIVTRAGTNEVQGRSFVFYRNRALNARGYFEGYDQSGRPVDLPESPFSLWQFGGTAGGPLRRNRAFLFGSVERLESTASNYVTIDDATPVPGVGTETLGTPAAILRNAGFAFDTGAVTYRRGGWQALGRIDVAAPVGQLMVRVNAAALVDENAEPWGGTSARSAGAALVADDFVAAGSLTTVFSTKLLNEARFQFARRDQTAQSLDPRCEGQCITDFQGGPAVDVLGVGSVGRQELTPQTRLVRLVEGVDTVTYSAGLHLIKSGIDFLVTDNSNVRVPYAFGGWYVFAPLPAIRGLLPQPISAIQAVALGLPARYIQGFGDPTGPFRMSDVSLFVQDEWRLRRDLTVRGGLRYQLQMWPATRMTAPGVGQYTFPRDYDNIAPRLSVAWASGGGATVVNGAWGLFYDDQITAMLLVARTLSGGDGIRVRAIELPLAAAAWAAPNRRLPESALQSPPITYAIDPRLRTPSARHMSAGVTRQIGERTFVSATVVHAKGAHQPGTIDYNPLLPDRGLGRRPEDIGGTAGTSAPVNQLTSFGETWYNGVLFAVTSRRLRGLEVKANYTLSKAEDTSTDFLSSPDYVGRGRSPDDPRGFPLDFDPRLERGYSLNDRRHQFDSYVLWTRGSTQVAAIAVIASGRPFTPLAGTDLNGDGDGGGFPVDRARRDPLRPDTAVRRGTGRLPGEATIDVRVAHNFLSRGRVRLEALVDIFNVFNRTNFTAVNTVFGTGPYPDSPLPSFGRLARAAPPRQVQLGARVRF